MVIAIVAASAAVLGTVVAFVALRIAAGRSNDAAEVVLTRVDGHLAAISESLTGAIDRLGSIRQEPAGDLRVTLDFDELLDALVATAAASTGADAVAARVQGPENSPVLATVGGSVGAALLQATPDSPDARLYRSATIDWTYPADEQEAAYRSSVMVPIVEDGSVTGTIAAYARTASAFRPEHVAALQSLVAEAGAGLANARRFARAESHSLVDPTTGLRNPRGYEIELEREIARARRTGRPLSVVVVELQPEGADDAVGELARLLGRASRATDIPCRRRDVQVAVILPETQSAGAERFLSRLQEEARSTLVLAPPHTFATGLAEWQASETAEALGARLASTLGARPAGNATPGQRLAAQADRLRVATGRDGFGERVEGRVGLLVTLEEHVAEARRLDHPLAVLVLDVDGFGSIAERLGPEAADEVVAEIAGRIRQSAGEGTVSRLGPDSFAVVLSEATVNDAEGLLEALQASLYERSPHRSARVTLSAGITALSEGDDARNALGRAEQALWQAKQAGHGTVVVAMTGSSATR